MHATSSFADSSASAQAPNEASPPSAVVIDRVAVRFMTPETGGMARPQFITDRVLALFARLEALTEGVVLPDGTYADRYVRSAVDRLVARAMLSALLLRRGEEPPNLPRMTSEAYAELADRVGGTDALAKLLVREGIEEAELTTMLRDRVRAAWYVDRAVTPIAGVTEDALREAFRGAAHPYRGARYEDVRDRFRRWVQAERYRSAEIEFLQSARSRVVVDAVHPLTADATVRR